MRHESQQGVSSNIYIIVSRIFQMCTETMKRDCFVSCKQTPAAEADLQDFRRDLQDFGREFRESMQVFLKSSTDIVHNQLALQAREFDLLTPPQEMKNMMQAFNTRIEQLEHKIEQRLALQDEKIEAIRTEMRATRCTCTLQ